MSPELGKPRASRACSEGDLRLSGVGTWCEVGWLPGVPRGFPHDLARVWHDRFVWELRGRVPPEAEVTWECQVFALLESPMLPMITCGYV